MPPCARADPEAGAGAGHLLRLWRAADRPRRAEREGVLRRTRRSQRRQCPPDLGSCRGRRPRDVRRRHHRRRRAHPGRAGQRARIHLWRTGFRVPGSRQERLPERPARASSTGAGCIRARSWSPTTSGCRARRNTARTCASSRASCGTPWSTRRISNTSRWCPTWCWSPTTGARFTVARGSACHATAPGGALPPTLRAARAR